LKAFMKIQGIPGPKTLRKVPTVNTLMEESQEFLVPGMVKMSAGPSQLDMRAAPFEVPRGSTRAPHASRRDVVIRHGRDQA
jgi:hypothetical protein